MGKNHSVKFENCIAIYILTDIIWNQALCKDNCLNETEVEINHIEVINNVGYRALKTYSNSTKEMNFYIYMNFWMLMLIWLV